MDLEGRSTNVNNQLVLSHQNTKEPCSLSCPFLNATSLPPLSCHPTLSPFKSCIQEIPYPQNGTSPEPSVTRLSPVVPNRRSTPAPGPPGLALVPPLPVIPSSPVIPRSIVPVPPIVPVPAAAVPVAGDIRVHVWRPGPSTPWPPVPVALAVRIITVEPIPLRWRRSRRETPLPLPRRSSLVGVPGAGVPRPTNTISTGVRI